MYHCYGICLDCKSVIFNVLTTINVFFCWTLADSRCRFFCWFAQETGHCLILNWKFIVLSFSLAILELSMVLKFLSFRIPWSLATIHGRKLVPQNHRKSSNQLSFFRGEWLPYCNKTFGEMLLSITSPFTDGNSLTKVTDESRQ